MRVAVTSVVCLAWVLYASLAAAQASRTPGRDGSGSSGVNKSPKGFGGQPVSQRPVYFATRIESPPKIDGVLDDDVWAAVPVISNFIQQVPHEGMPATEKTEVKIAYDRDNLYVAARCHDSEPDKIVANELRRDVVSISTKDDTFAIVLDPFHDYRNGIAFIVTPKGSLHDLLVTDERQFNWDWNTVWDARTRMDDQGWTVEMVIPFKSLRYDAETPQTWGMNLRRSIIRKNEHDYLTRIPAELGIPGLGKLSAAADLKGLDGLAKSHHVEFKPFVTTGMTRDFAKNPGGGAESSLDGGIDLKYGVTQGLNLDVTFNTDFAQVEADTQQVNLTRFSLFFPEKRDFFLEGRDIYAFGVPQEQNANATLLFFSRRIGLDGGRAVPIMGGARLTGRAGRYSVGMLDIRTDRSGATPGTNFTVVRIKRDFLERSNLGAIFTSKSPSGRDSNQAFGIDGNFFFHRSSSAALFLARSRTAGLSGGEYAARARLNYSVDLWGLDFEYLTVGPNFNPEVGFVRRRDIRSSFGSIRYSPRPNRRRVRQIFLTADMEYLTDTNNVLQTRVSSVGFEIESPRADKLKVSATRNFENLDRPFRIQPTIVIPAGAYRFDAYAVRSQLGSSRKLSGVAEYSLGGFLNGTKRTLTLNSVSKPSSHLSYALNYQRNAVNLPQGQFVTHLVGTQLDCTVNTRLFTSAFLQWNSDAALAVVNFRLRYIYKLGSDLFVVYNENRQTRGLRAGALDRSFLVKFTYLLRL